MNKDFQQLRRVFEGSDPFMGTRHRGGHQIVGLRRRKRLVPMWARSNQKIQAILLRSFPKLKTDLKQRTRAARWARIIYLYYKLGYTYTQVAEEIEMFAKGVHAMVRGISRAAQGRRVDGKGLIGMNPVGRPRKLKPQSKQLGEEK